MSQRKKAGGWSKLSGSTKRKIEQMLAQGWRPYSERPQFMPVAGKAGPSRD